MEADEFDLAGFCIGIAERSRLLDGTAARAGDAIVGLASTGLHANGYSLVRSLVADTRPRPARAVPGAAAPGARRRRGGRGPRAGAGARARDAGRRAPDADARSTPSTCWRIREALAADGSELRGIAHVTGGGLPGNVPRALPAGLGARLRPVDVADAVGDAPARRARRDRGRRAARDVQRGARAWSLVVPRGGRAARPWRSPRRVGSTPGRSARSSTAAALGGARYARRRRRDARARPDRRRGVRDGLEPAARWSRRPRAARSAGEVALVFADRAVPGARLGGRAGDRRPCSCRAATTRRLADDAGRGRAGRRRARRLPAARRAGGAGARSTGRILNVHPSLLPAFPGLHAVRDALAAGVAITGVTVHLVDATLDGGPIVAQEAVPGPPRRRRGDPARAAPRRRAPAAARVPWPRCWPGRSSVGRAPAGRVRRGGVRRARAGPAPRAAVRSTTRRASRSSARGLVARGLRARQHRGDRPGAARGRPAGHRRRRGHRLPRDARRPRQDAPSARSTPACSPTAGAPTTARRSPPPGSRRSSSSSSTSIRSPRPRAGPGIAFDDLVEEIDIGGPSMVRAAAKNHASVAIVTDARAVRRRPGGARRARRDPARAALGAGRRGVRAHRRLRRPDRGRAARAGCATPASTCPPEPGLPGAEDPYPPVLTISMAKVETLRYGENPHQPAARYRRTDREPRAAEGPFAGGEPPLQGKALSYNNVLDASAAAVARAAAARARRRHRQAHQPVRRGRARDAPRGLGRGPRGRPGVGVRRRRRRHAARSTARSPSGWPRSSSRSSSRRPSTTARARSSRPSPTCASSWTRRSTRRRTGRPDDARPARRRLAGLAADRRRRGARRRRPTRSPTTRRPGRRVSRRSPTDTRAARPRPRLAPLPGRGLERDRPRP